MRITNYMAAAAAMMLFVAGPAATAQTAGSTSGPAAGSPVAPNTAVQKGNPANPASAEQAKEGVSLGAAVSAGSPGATAKEGTQGEAQKPGLRPPLTARMEAVGDHREEARREAVTARAEMSAVDEAIVELAKAQMRASL